MAEQPLTIGEVASSSGMATSALRYYEEVGLIRPVARVSGRRRFDRAVLHRLAVIDLLRVAGFTLREIRQLLSSRNWRPRAARKLDEVEGRIASARAAKRILQAALACDCDRLEGCEVAVAAGGSCHHGSSREHPPLRYR